MKIRIKLSQGIKHSLWSILDAAFYPVVYMATVPIMMHYMGMVSFGFWIVLNTLITVLQLCNLKLDTTTLRFVSYELGKKDLSRLKDTMNGILQIAFLLLATVTCIGFVLSIIVVKNGWWGLKDIPASKASICIVLAGVITGLKYIDQVFQNIIKGDEQFKAASILNMINRFGLLGINLFLVIYGFQITDLLIANVVFLVVYLAVQYYVIRRNFPFYKPGKVNDRSVYKSLLSYSVWPWLQSILIIITFQTDRFWVSSFAGLKEVSSYGLVATMFNHIHMIFTAAALWMLPRIAAMTSRGDDPSRLYNNVRSTLFGIIILSLLFFYFASPVIFRVMFGAQTYESMRVYIKAFVAFEIVFAHTIMPVFYLYAAGKEKTATMLTLVFCSLCYLFMIGGLWIYKSPVAMVNGMTLSLCITMPVVNYVVQRNIDKRASWKYSVLEMMPMYASILLLATNNIWITAVLVVTIIVLLWKYYLVNVINKRGWRQLGHI